MFTREELEKELNTICLLEFQANYDKSEMKRILSTGDYHERAKELEEKLNKDLKPNYIISICDSGSIMILKEVGPENSIIAGMKSYTREKIICAPIYYKLPYGYCMGAKVGKRVMQKVVSELKQYTNLY